MSSAVPLNNATEPGTPPIRVLIVDDSAVARAALSRLVADAPEFEVVAALDGARRAIEHLAQVDVDIILLDIQMPGLDGLAAMPALIEASGGARILIVSTLAGEGARATVEALALGAADTLAKPALGSFGRQFGETLVNKMLRLGKATPTAQVVTSAPQLLRTAPDTLLSCIAIGASTGGLHALAAFFGGLPAECDAPILITQHLPPSFMPFFADQIAALADRPAQVATNGMKLVQNQIYIAPGDHHIGLLKRTNSVHIMLLDHDEASGCCPSVDPMFAAVADAYGEAGLGIVLSGMGRDGALGADILVDKGGTVIAQDSASSAVWGMPGTIARAGLASLIGAPGALAAYVVNRGTAK